MDIDLTQILNDLGIGNEQEGGVIEKKIYLHDHRDMENLELLPIADWHLGSVGANKSFMTHIVRYCMNHENCFAVGVGDLAETATKASIGAGFFEEDMHIQEQMDSLYDILAPLADTGRLWGLEEGNHCFRATALAGIHPMKIVADRLGVPFLGYNSYHLLKVGEQTYRICAVHNHGGGGRTTASKVKASENSKDVAEADVYITGHTHYLGNHKLPIFTFDEENLIMKERMRYFVSCGSALNYFGSYAEMQVLPPYPISVPLIIFRGNRFSVCVIDE